jgi:hypothetical protein
MLAAVRIACGPSLFFALCLFLDLADPLVAGAWPVDPDRSVEGVSAAAHRTSVARCTISLPSFATAARLQHINPVEPSAVRFLRSAVSAVSEWVGLQRAGYAAASDPPPLAEDH